MVTNGYDPTNGLGRSDKGFVIHFVHVPTRQTCHFKSMLTAWEDTFKQDWNSYETVGRMDPIKTYKRTTRVINFSIEIPSYDVEEAAHNFEEIQKLIQMSYPTFNTSTTSGQPASNSTSANSEAGTQVQNAKIASALSPQAGASGIKTVSHMVSPPFFRVKFSNWLNDPSEDPGLSNNDAYGPHNDPNTKGSGLYGTIETVKFSPDFSNGFYGPNNLYSTAAQERSEKTLIPSLLKLDIVFNVLHTNELGYNAATGEARTPSFPYNADRINAKVKVR